MIKNHKPKSVVTLMQRSHLQQEAMRMSELNILLQKYLKQYQISDCRIGNVKSGCLTLEVQSAAWKMRLQFMQSDILSALREKVPGLIKMKVNVNPRLNLSKNTLRSTKPLQQKRASLMPKDVAESFLILAEGADPKLKEALTSLALYVKK